MVHFLSGASAAVSELWARTIPETAPEKKIGRQVSPTLPESLLTLHKYFLYASTTRKLTRERVASSDRDAGYDLEFEIRYPLWYATLYTVADGWRQLALGDEVVSELIDRPEMRLLSDFRNIVVHYRPQYFERRQVAMLDSRAFVAWAHALHSAIGRALLEQMAAPDDAVRILRNEEEQRLLDLRRVDAHLRTEPSSPAPS